MLSLYRLCIQCLAYNSNLISSLEGIPFDPFVKDLVQIIFCDPLYLNANVLNKIGSSQGVQIRRETGHHYSMQLSKASQYGSGKEQIRFISTSFPLFLCKIDLSGSNISDDDVWRLGILRNLIVLDLTANPITDRAIAHICHMNGKDGSLHNLKVLSVANNRQITDYALKFIPKMESVAGIDLSATNISDVALKYLCKNGYRVICASKELETSFNKNTNCPDHAFTLISWEPDAQHSKSSMTHLLDNSPNPGYHIPCNSHLEAFVNRTILSQQGRVPQNGKHMNDLGWWINADVYKALCFIREQKPTTEQLGKRPLPDHLSTDLNSPQLKKPVAAVQDYLSMFESEFGLDTV